jgi:tRNA (guanine37-N1)-methyltransferase
MMPKQLCAHIPKKKAQEIKQYLLEKQLIDKTVVPKSTSTHLLYAVTKKIKKFSLKYTQEEFASKKSKNIKELMQEKVPPEILAKIKNAYDRIGTIAIIEIDEQQRIYEEQIAQAILIAHPSIKTVLRKDSEHQGEFRTQKMKHLAGEKTTVTTHNESAIKLDVDVQDVYFSPRLSSERLRIAKLVQNQEQILVLFSGCAPYVCILAKHSPAKHIDGVELNPVGHEFAVRNIQKNHIKNATVYNCDAQTFVAQQKLEKGYDRILMPLPKTAGEFLESVIGRIQANATEFWIHFYDFLHEDEFDKAVDKIRTVAKAHQFQVSNISIHTCGCQGVRTYRICVDAFLKKV